MRVHTLSWLRSICPKGLAPQNWTLQDNPRFGRPDRETTQRAPGVAKTSELDTDVISQVPNACPS